MTATNELHTASNLKAMVRGMIDNDFAAQLPIEALACQLDRVAREVQHMPGLALNNAARMNAMQSLANELHAQPAMALAA